MSVDVLGNENSRRSLWAVIKSMHPKKRWKGNNGYSHVLRICLPLIASNISVSAMLFTDRLFLSRYSMDAIAASLPSGVALVTVSSFFQGLISYVSVFTAQYTGAGRPERAAAALWQGIYLSLVSGLLIALTFFAAPFIFEVGGHAEHVQELEVTYYRILAIPSFLNLAYFAMSSFLAGLGRTRIVMWINLFGAFINIPLAYFLIFGISIGDWQIVPELGTVGAGLATATAWLLTTAVFIFFVFNKKMEKSHKIFQVRALDWTLMRRMITFGSPGGFQRFLELLSFTFFAFIIGRLGELYLAGNNIIFSIEALSFFPMIGVGATVSILVGQSIGRGQKDQATEAVISGVGISSLYMVFIACVFLIFPEPLLKLFLAPHYEPEAAAQILNIGVVLLRFVVVYTIFDGVYLCCFGALSGAGDVWFPMAVMGLGGVFCLVVPILTFFALDIATVYTLWGAFVFYVLVLTTVATWRFGTGKWKSMQVIEKIRVADEEAGK